MHRIIVESDRGLIIAQDEELVSKVTEGSEVMLPSGVHDRDREVLML